MKIEGKENRMAHIKPVAKNIFTVLFDTIHLHYIWHGKQAVFFTQRSF